MRERLEYAVIGLVLGLLLGGLLWAFGSGFGFQHRSWVRNTDLFTWLKYSGGAGAVAGFFLKAKVGDLIGSVLHTEYEAEIRRFESSWWWVLLLAVVVVIVWAFAR
jgi:hypothetical protein